MQKINYSGRLLLLAMLMLSAGALTSCAPKPAPPAIYLQGSSQTVQLHAGDQAPFDGWLVSNEAMSDLLAVGASSVAAP